VALCLATAAIGGIWVSAAADFGPEGVKERYVQLISLSVCLSTICIHLTRENDRFEQVQPKFIFSVDAVVCVTIPFSMYPFWNPFCFIATITRFISICPSLPLSYRG